MARKQTPKEKAEQIYDRFIHLKNEWNTFLGDMTSMAELYFLDHWVKEGAAKEGEERVTLPTHSNVVDMAHALLVGQRRRFHVVPSNHTIAEQSLTTEMESWLRGVFHVNHVRCKEDAVSMAIWNALVKKIGWVRCRWDPYLATEVEGGQVPPQFMPGQAEAMMSPEMMGATAPMPAVPMARFKELPIVLESIAPENVFARFGGPRGTLYLYYSAKRSIEDIASEVGAKALPKKYKDMDWREMAETKVYFMDYWGWDEKGQLETATLIGTENDSATGEFISGRELQKAEGYVDIPYVPFYCFRTPEGRPHFMCRGLLDSSKDLVHDQEKLLSTMMHAVKMFGVMPLITEANRPIEIPTSLGDHVSLRPGEKVYFPQWPGTPPDMMRLLTITEDKVQESGFPAVAFGRGPSGSSGYAIGQQNEGARARLNLPRANAELALTHLAHLIVGLAETFSPDTAIPVWGVEKSKMFYKMLTGKQMQGHLIEVAIEEDLPADKMRNATIGGQLKATGVLSNQTIAEKYMGIEDWDEEQKKILIERIMSNPVFMMATMLRATAQDQDLAMQLVRAEVAKLAGQMTQAPSPGAQAQAPVPGAPTPGMGQAPTPQMPMMPSNMIPPIAQGQVLRQEVGLPPTNEGMMQ